MKKKNEWLRDDEGRSKNVHVRFHAQMNSKGKREKVNEAL